MTSKIDKVMKDLEEGRLISEMEIKTICEQATKIFKTQENVRKIQAPVSVCGDIHGQFTDLLELFQIGGTCPDTSYLFLGDYVDRGKNSVETIIYLFCLKIKHPERITLIRGNHESRVTSREYGFHKECLAKYRSENVWKYITDVFDYLSIAALIDNKIFAAHGGLSPKIQFVNEVKKLKINFFFRYQKLTGFKIFLLMG